MSIGKLVDQSSGQIFPLGFEVVTIGRQADNDVILADPQVSRHHAEITMQGGRWLIRDLDSANGTYVNGQRITGPQLLRHGDLVRVGGSSFQVEIPSAAARQDTLVDRIPAAALAPSPARRPRTGLLVALVVIVALALAAAAYFLWLHSPGEGEATTAPGTGATPVAAASATATSTIQASARPSETALPTQAPPSPQPTATPAPTVTPAPTDTSLPPPVVGYFRANPATIEQGQCARLEWGQVENTTRLTLVGVGTVGSSGKIDVCLDDTKIYTLEATGPGGTTEKSVQVTVVPPTGSIIEYFRVVPSIISPGDCAQLEWGKVDNATAAIIEPDVGGVGTPGNLEVCPGNTTTYVLTAENPQGSSTARATLIVSGDTSQKPVIPFFTANPARIEAGQCTTLSWGRVDYATEVTIDHNIGGIATPGSQEVCPGSTTTYLMTAIGPGGITEYDLTVAVSPGQLDELPDLVVESILFEPNPCYRGLKCKVRVKIRNDGPQGADHFVLRWAPEGSEAIPVEWDMPGLAAGEERELSYTWIPDRTRDSWPTTATVDPGEEVDEIEEGEANRLEQVVTVLEP